jgi:VanZ family protein
VQPPVLLAGVLFPRPLLAVLGGSVLSALIEFLQAVAPIIGRACDASDWITNTIGAVLGGLIAGAALALKRRSRATS